MRVTVLLFALARSRAGRSEVTVEVPVPATVADLKRALAAECPALAGLVPGLRIAVNSEYRTEADPVPPGAEVAAILPVSGGGIEGLAPS